MQTVSAPSRAAAFFERLKPTAASTGRFGDASPSHDRFMDSHAHLDGSAPRHCTCTVGKGMDFDDDAKTVDMSCLDHRSDEHDTAWSVIASMCGRMDAALPTGPFPDFTVKDQWALEGVDHDDAAAVAERDIDYRVIGMDSTSPFPQTFVLKDSAGEFDRFPGLGMTFADIRARMALKTSERMGGTGLWNTSSRLSAKEIVVTVSPGHDD
jgi:hypothetical protein